MGIKRLSDSELIGRFGKLVQTERKITHLVLECIAEIDLRKIYLDQAYPSLFEFLLYPSQRSNNRSAISL